MSDLFAEKQDMALYAVTLPMTAPEDIPLTYKIGDEEYRGIPASFSRVSVRRTSTDANIVTYTAEGVHPSGLRVRVEAVSYRDFPVTEWIAYFINESDEKSPVVSDIRLGGTVSGKDPVLVHSNGDTCRPDGYEIYEDAVKAPITLFPADGTPNNGAFPYMRLRFADFGVNLAVGWTGQWEADFVPCEGADGVSFSVGQKRCRMAILPGETMRTPRLTLMAYAGNEAHGRNLWRKWYFAHILPREKGEPLPPKLCLHVWNVGGPEFTGATEEQQTTGLRTYVERGLRPDIWWFDAGWYPCDFDWPRTGTWEHDPARFPNGLTPIGTLCEETGTEFLLWFEPERVRHGTWLWNEHPEWLIIKSEKEDALLDLGNPDARAWLTAHVIRKIREYHVHIYRQDFNFAPLSYWQTAEAEDRIGAKENLHVQGYLAYWDALLDAFPGMWIDSCASGGRRNDLDTMRRAVPLHYTDVGYGNHPIKQKQHRLMFEWIPYFRAHNMSWDAPDGTYPPAPYANGVTRFSFHCALAPSLTDMTACNGPDEEFALAAEMVPIWRRAAEIELRADYYPLTECRKNPHDWYAMQFDDPEKQDGFVQIIRNTQVEEDTFMLFMHVNDPEAEYFFENMESGDMMQLTGAQLADGIPLTLPEKRSGVVWFYHTVTF